MGKYGVYLTASSFIPYCAQQWEQDPHPCNLIYSLCYFREQKRGSQGHGWIHERKKGVLLLVLAE